MYLKSNHNLKINLLHAGGINYPPNQFGPPPPSPVSRFAAAATSPGPVQDLSSYINSAANTSADGLGYTATSPQPTGFGHAMAVSKLPMQHFCNYSIWLERI